jgi:transposase
MRPIDQRNKMIEDMHASGVARSEIAARFGLAEKTITNILSKASAINHRALDSSGIAKAQALCDAGKTRAEAARIMCVSRSTIDSVVAPGKRGMHRLEKMIPASGSIDLAFAEREIKRLDGDLRRGRISEKFHSQAKAYIADAMIASGNRNPPKGSEGRESRQLPSRNPGRLGPGGSQENRKVHPSV